MAVKRTFIKSMSGGAGRSIAGWKSKSMSELVSFPDRTNGLLFRNGGNPK